MTLPMCLNALTISETAEVIDFDYSALPSDLADTARAAAQRIKDEIRRQAASYIETGRELLLIKDKLGHGHFGPWLKAEFDFDERTAQRYMLAAERFADKSDIVSLLPQGTVLKLAARSTPDHVRDEVVKRIGAGERIAPQIIHTMVDEAREADRKAKEEARQAERWAKLTPKQQEEHLLKEKRQRRNKAQREAQAARREAEYREAAARREAATVDLLELLQRKLDTEELRLFQDLLKETSSWELETRLHNLVNAQAKQTVEGSEQMEAALVEH